MKKNYDIAILGAGPGGYVAAIRAAQLGAKVALIEKDQVGGVCLNKGCIPTKAIIYSTSLMEKIKESSDFGIDINGSFSVNLKKIVERKNKIIESSIKGINLLLKSNNVDLFKGYGKLISKNKILVTQGQPPLIDAASDSYEITSSNIIIATGSIPQEIKDIPFDGKNIISSNEALDETNVPKHILIIGAGIIGCEWAFIYKSLGAEVSIVELMPRVLPAQDEDVSKLIEREFKKNKINIYLKNKVKNVEKEKDKIKVTLEDTQSLIINKILVSIGRKYNTENIGLEEINLKTGKHSQIEVNEYLQTNIQNIYAVGDVIGGKMLAHKASYDGILAIENILQGKKKTDYSFLPSVIFTRPEIGSFGITEDEAKEKNINYKIGFFPYRASGKAMVMGEINGFIKILASKNSKKILGAHIIGPTATEIIHEIALASSNSLPLESIIKTIHGHPTISEIIKEAAEDFFDISIHFKK